MQNARFSLGKWKQTQVLPRAPLAKHSFRVADFPRPNQEKGRMSFGGNIYDAVGILARASN